MSDKKTPQGSTSTGATAKPAATSVGTTAGQGTKSAGAMADDAKRKAADTAQDLKSKAKAEASSLADKAYEMADDRLDDVKSEATSRIDETAEHIRNAGHEFGDDSYQAQAADYLASNLTRAADMVRSQDLSSLTDEISDFARRNPAIFLGGAALLGFAAARLMKASERGSSGSSYASRNDRYARNDRFDSPPRGISNTPYDRPARGVGTGGSY